ncbi:hypothetical protein IE53DRAFT_213407 [Violaceomyces palustris]|uniref:Uncharacterized protein n=1 Tax=Violaceomyces palustris TaxID=1673888 RepID=A0ACD0P4S0_9BASI|nr:hypothetical protein IE53DRAFT_213407 [Violaceomyces palustris]
MATLYWPSTSSSSCFLYEPFASTNSDPLGQSDRPSSSRRTAKLPRSTSNIVTTPSFQQYLATSSSPRVHRRGSSDSSRLFAQETTCKPGRDIDEMVCGTSASQCSMGNTSAYPQPLPTQGKWTGQSWTPDYAEQIKALAANSIPTPPPAPPVPPPPQADEVVKKYVPASTASEAPVSPKPISSIADWCAQMVCYIWFAGIAPPSTAVSTAHGSLTPCRSPETSYAPQQSSPLAKRHQKTSSLNHIADLSSSSSTGLERAVEAHLRSSGDLASYRQREESARRNNCAETNSLRLAPTPRFKTFVRDMLNTTQVSNSVVILALMYIHRLKSKHPELRGQEGSEFRLFVTALMLANKFLDDHTYTNKTWSELSGIELKDVTKMEIEFWMGLSMRIYVSEADFRNWLKMLETLGERRQHAILSIMRRNHEEARRQASHTQHQQNLASVSLASYRASHQSRPRLAADSTSAACTRTPDIVEAPYGIVTPPFHPYPCNSVSPPSYSNRSFASTQAANSAGQCSPDRPTKKFASGMSGDDFNSYYAARVPSVSPLGDLGARQNIRSDMAVGERSAVANIGSQSQHQQEQQLFRSVFEPAVSTPNTLLAPFSGSYNTTVQPHRQHPLSYWQLAAGHDRGILGVHLPAPVPAAHQEYYTPYSRSRRPSIVSPASSGSSVTKRLISTTTPYATPSWYSANEGDTQGSTLQALEPSFSNGASLDCLSFHPQLYQYNNSQPCGAPHAPFNNAQGTFIDPWTRSR